MKDAEGYDVLRLIEHNRSCYVSSDYVKGTPLIRRLRDHPDLPKEQLFLWIHEMARQLECIHKCRGKPCYSYVNPYSIIITGEGKLYFLDVSAGSNEKILSIMRRRSVREHFLPSEKAYYQKESIFPDIYGLGKTIQYLLSESEPDPGLTKREEIQFQNLISRSIHEHSKRAYVSVSELRRQIPVYHTPGTLITKKRAVLMIAALSVIIAGVTSQQERADSTLASPRPEEEEKETERGTEIREPAAEEYTEEERTEGLMEEERENVRKVSLLKKELGFLYFLDKRDYRKSREYFLEDSGDVRSQKLARLSEFMLMGHADGEGEPELLLLLEELENDAPGTMQGDLYRCLIRGYMLLDSREAADAVLRLGEMCMGDADEEAERELAADMAVSFERTGETGKAIEKYTEVLSGEKEETAREEVYENLVRLNVENGEPDRALGVCRQGIEELTGSVSLRLLHIRMLCQDKDVERRLCARTIGKYITEIPEIADEEEFKTLEKEYEITMKGEKVCVGK